MAPVRRALFRSIWFALVIVLGLCTSCGNDNGSVLLPQDGLHFRYFDANVESPNPVDCPALEDGDTLYSARYSGDRREVFFILWPHPESDCTHLLYLRTVVSGSAELCITMPQVCERDTIDSETVRYACDLGQILGFWVETARKDTCLVSDFTFRVCCKDEGCLSWSAPISFTVIDTLSR